MLDFELKIIIRWRVKGVLQHCQIYFLRTRKQVVRVVPRYLLEWHTFEVQYNGTAHVLIIIWTDEFLRKG
jgi:hypothetical protein